MEQQKDNEIHIYLLKSQDYEEIEGLNPYQFDSLVNDAYTKRSLVRFQEKIANEILDKISIFRMAEDYIKIIDREKSIKLTEGGALQRKVLVELYDKKYIYDSMIEKGINKLTQEKYCSSIMTMRAIVELSNITKKANGKITLTKKGMGYLMPENRQAFFETLFMTFCNKYNWGYHDAYISAPIGNLGSAFTIFLLAKYGNEYRPDRFYADKYLRAFPDFLKYFTTSDYWTDRDYFSFCYTIRTIDRFLEWFGMIEYENREVKHKEVRNIKAMDILTEVFKIDCL